MPSSYTTRLRLEDIATGEKDGTWGDIVDVTFSLLEEAIAGVASVTHDDSANYSLTSQNGSSDEARQMVLEIGGSLTAARNVVCPTVEKVYLVYNNTTGGFAVTIKTSAGTGVSIPNGERRLVYCDGTNVVPVTKALAFRDTINNDDWSGTDLSVENGGTGGSTQAAARAGIGAQQDVITTRGDLIRGSSSGAAERFALGAANSLVKSDGTDLVYSTLTALMDTVFGSTRGMMLRRNASSWGAVSLGADNTVIASDGTDAAWETLSSLLDSVFGSTRGMILYRGASSWEALGVGTNGYFLKSQGAGANPAWAEAYSPGNGPTGEISEVSLSSTLKEITAALPAGVKWMDILFEDISFDSNNDHFLIQLGTSGGYVTSGYLSSSDNRAGGAIPTSTAGFIMANVGGAKEHSGMMRLSFRDGNGWYETHGLTCNTSPVYGAGRIADLGGEVTSVRVTRSGSNDTFDGGTASIIYGL